MKLIIARDYDEMSKKASYILIHQLLLNPQLTLGLATGSTPVGLYQELIRTHREMHVSFAGVTTFNLDEYVGLDREHPQSYWTFMQQQLFAHIDVPTYQIHILDGMTKNPEQACNAFEQLLEKKPVDIQILGIGSNGHIAFNEPGTSFTSRTRQVSLKESTITDNARFFASKDEVPTQALSMGIATIMQAKQIILLAAGANKAKALKSMMEGPVDPSCPASMLQRHPNVLVVADEEAASLLAPGNIPNQVGDFHIFGEHNIPKGQTIVVISPHPDDASIGPGGTIALFAQYNQVHTFVMTTGHRAYIPHKTNEEKTLLREQEVIRESAILGIKPHFLRLGLYENGEKAFADDIRVLHGLFQDLQPAIVLLPQTDDKHPTHKQSRFVTVEACKLYGKTIQLWNYESPWGLFGHGSFNTIVSLPESMMDKKIAAIKEHVSQVERVRYDVAAEALAKLRGALIPEQELSGFGQASITVHPHLELFSVETT